MAKGRLLISAILASSLIACSDSGGGGGGTQPLGNGLIVSKSATVIDSKYYPFQGKEYNAYSARLENISGEPDLYIRKQSDYSSKLEEATSSTTGVEDISFIAATTEKLIADVTHDYWWSYDGESKFKLKVYNNNLTVDGASRERVTGLEEEMYFSFDAEAGQAYQVKLTPTSGRPILKVYSGTTNSDTYDSLVPDSATLIGTSDNADLQDESVVFVASETKKHYISAKNDWSSTVDMNFTISVVSSTAAPDLQVSVDDLSYSDSTNTVIVDYTVSNNGAANAAATNLHFWLDSATVPSAGSTGDDVVSIAALEAGETRSLRQTIDVGAVELGTFYAYIDPEGVVSEADETNNASVGTQWAAPVLVPQTFDFEDSLKPDVFTYDGAAAWAVVPGGAYSTSNYSFRSGTIGLSSKSCFAVSVEGTYKLTFDWKAVTDTSGDDITFKVNGYTKSTVQYSGGDPANDYWEAEVYYPTSTGIYTYEWCYYKGTSDIPEITDAAWVDNIKFRPELPDLSVAIDSVVSDGSNVTVNYKVSNNTGASSAATTVSFWMDPVSAPTVGSAGSDAEQNLAIIPGGGSYTGSVTIPSATTAGTVYAIVDNNNVIEEDDESNNVVSRIWSVPVQAPFTFNFEDGILPSSFIPSADAGWQIDTSNNVNPSNYNIRASSVANGETACIAVTAENSSGVSFDWTIDANSNDVISFYVNGTNNGSLFGSSSSYWFSKSVIGLTPGTYEYKWCYRQNTTLSTTAANTGWVDNIDITN